jgi:repressor LexA
VQHREGLDAVRARLYADDEHTFVIDGGGPMLTERQRQIWNYLVDYVDRHGYPPTVREIGTEVGLASPSTVHAHLANLERAGLLRRDPTKPRALELIGREGRVADPAQAASLDAVRLPLVGDIAAGSPLLAEQNIEEYLTLPRSTRGDFLLRVKGESMIEAGILDGDLVIVQRAQDARNGEIVVALVGSDESADEATVKTFYREADRIRLQPENATLAPIYSDHVEILGRVVGVFREL